MIGPLSPIRHVFWLHCSSVQYLLLLLQQLASILHVFIFKTTTHSHMISGAGLSFDLQVLVRIA